MQDITEIFSFISQNIECFYSCEYTERKYGPHCKELRATSCRATIFSKGNLFQIHEGLIEIERKKITLTNPMKLLIKIGAY